MNGNGMSGGIGAGELALLNNNNPNEMVWPLVWLAFLRGNGGGLFGGGDAAGAAAVTSQADAIRGIQESVNATGLASCQNTNAIQAGIASAAADAAACCCNTRIDTLNQAGQTREAINAQGANTQMGFALQATSLADKFAGLQLQACIDTRDLQAQLAKCCCDSQLQIAQQNATMAQQHCEIMNKIDIQSRDNRIAILEDQLGVTRGNLSNCEQTNMFASLMNSQTAAIIAAIQNTCGGSSSS